MSHAEIETVEHASAVSIDGWAVLIFGQPGSGKSDLALRLIAGGACLIADDGTKLRRDGDAVYALPPASIAGMMEVRGVGVVTVPGAATAADAFPVALAVNLVSDPALVARMPEPASRELAGVAVPCVSLWGFAASAVAVVGVALDLALGRRSPSP